MHIWRKISEQWVWKIIIINRITYLEWFGQGRYKGVINFFWIQRLGLLTKIPIASIMCKRWDQTSSCKLVGIRQMTLNQLQENNIVRL